jgi:hypothetical protein
MDFCVLCLGFKIYIYLSYNLDFLPQTSKENQCVVQNLFALRKHEIFLVPKYDEQFEKDKPNFLLNKTRITCGL